MIKLYTLIFLMFCISGCTNHTDTIIPSDMSKWESELKPSLDKLSEDEKKLVAAFLMRKKMGEAFGVTLGDHEITLGKAIELQKEWLSDQEKKHADEKALKEKIEAERTAQEKIFYETITVTVLKVKLVKEDFMTNQVIQLGFKNKGQRDIAGVKGSMKFIDMFGNEIGMIGFSFTDGIKSDGTAQWSGSRHYNQFMPEHRALANLQEGKYTTKFQPEMIVFKDGTKLNMPE